MVATTPLNTAAASHIDRWRRIGESRMKRAIFLVGIGLAGTLGITAPEVVQADVLIQGRVVNESGSAIQNADLDWYNRDLNMDIDPIGDHTDVLGNFSVLIPPGRYDVTIIGPPTNQYAAEFIKDIDLDVSQTLSDITLLSGALVTAIVTDQSAIPLLGAQVLFEDTTTEDELFLDRPRTDLTGTFSQVIPFGTYDITISGTQPQHLPVTQSETVVAAPFNLGTFALGTGVVVTGTVHDTNGSGIFNVDLDVLDENGSPILTLNDNTDFLGQYSILVPTGNLTLRYTPAPGSPFAAEERSQAVAGPGYLGITLLQAGISVSGTVRDHLGNVLGDLDIDVVDPASGVERFVPGDNTAIDGTFSFLLPAGTYDYAFQPTPVSGLASKPLWNQTVTTPVSLPNVVLSPGIQITGSVTGSGIPLAGVDMNFVLPSGKKFPTPYDDTDSAGNYAVRIEPGTYTVQANPPVGWNQSELTNQLLTTNTVLDMQVTAGTVSVNPTLEAPGLRIAPNPFHSSTQFFLADRVSSETISASIFDIHGRRIRNWERITDHQWTWEGLNDQGQTVSPGVYFVRVRDRQEVLTKRVIRVN